MSNNSQPVALHLKELKSRIISTTVVFIVLTVLGLSFSGIALKFIQSDLNVQLNALRGYEVIFTQIMIASIFGVISTMPVAIYQSLRFAKPGLKEEEYKTLRNFLPISYILFLIGAVFSYEIIVKISLEFFKNTAETAGVKTVWGLKNTIGFALKLSFLTGLSFQLPIISSLLAKLGLLKSEHMLRYRKYFIVATLVLAAVATPPDIISQVLITTPIIGLYQLSIFLVSFIEN